MDKKNSWYFKYRTSICGKIVASSNYIWRLQIGKCNESQFGSLIGVIPNDNVVIRKDGFVALKDRFDIAPYNGYIHSGHMEVAWFKIVNFLNHMEHS